MERSARAKKIYEATFEPKIKTYISIFVMTVMAATIVGIVLIPFWLVLGRLYLNRYFESLHCELTTRALHFKKGVLVTTDRTIPLDKIQDLAFKEGPLLRYLGLSSLQIETAGQSTANAVDMKLIGIVDAGTFRQIVMDQRDEVTYNRGSHATTAEAGNDHPLKSILENISDTLKRIENQK